MLKGTGKLLIGSFAILGGVLYVMEGVEDMFWKRKERKIWSESAKEPEPEQ